MFRNKRRSLLILILGAATLAGQVNSARGAEDFVVQDVFEAALDLPRIYFLFKRTADGPPVLYQGRFEPNYGFLDTGASGFLLSKETTGLLEIQTHPTAQYVDVGVGGEEYFDVSEPLYVGIADHDSDPYNLSNYEIMGPWRIQVKQYTAQWPEQPVDVVGVPVMAGKVAVLDTGRTNTLAEYLSARVTEPDDPTIPDVDFEVPLRFEKYTTASDPRHVPPLPVMAYNPVIDGIEARQGATTSEGTWLLDTGAMLSLISTEQGVKLGFTDANGEPVVTPDFYQYLGGVGNIVEVPGFVIDELRVPTLAGYDLVYKDASVAVHDIGIWDEDQDEFVILDGVFGSNFLSASARIEGGWPVDFALTPFEHVVIDMNEGLMGMDVDDAYTLPRCGDAEHPRPAGDIDGDCEVGWGDLRDLSNRWLDTGCGAGNDFCQGADISADGEVDMADLGRLTGQWEIDEFVTRCGGVDNPWLAADLNRDCVVDMGDMHIMAEEWLNDCGRLNFDCRGGDFNNDGIVNLSDYAQAMR